MRVMFAFAYIAADVLLTGIGEFCSPLWRIVLTGIGSGFFAYGGCELYLLLKGPKLRLIASSPDLLKSLKRLVEHFHAYENGWLTGDKKDWAYRIGLPLDLKEARTAIARAEGKQ